MTRIMGLGLAMMIAAAMVRVVPTMAAGAALLGVAAEPAGGQHTPYSDLTIHWVHDIEVDVKPSVPVDDLPNNPQRGRSDGSSVVSGWRWLPGRSKTFQIV